MIRKRILGGEVHSFSGTTLESMYQLPFKLNYKNLVIPVQFKSFEYGTHRSIVYMDFMFKDNTAITRLVFNNWNLSKARYINNCFSGCSNLQSVDGLSNLNMPLLSFSQQIFYNCSSLTSLDLSGWIIPSVTSAIDMFYNCSNLTSLNLSNWNVQSLENTSSMFHGCSSLTSLDLSSWDVLSITRTVGMFRNCSSLTSVNLSGWNVSSLTDAFWMFQDCPNLTSVNLSGWNASSIVNMDYMFYNCSSLTSLDLSCFDISSIESMQLIFYHCTNLTSLNLSGWHMPSDISSTGSLGIFRDCSKLNRIKCPRDFRDWCLANADHIDLPDAMKEGGSGTWEIVD